jgi:ribosomal protein S18 acetylase RimI-like enzyme
VSCPPTCDRTLRAHPSLELPHSDLRLAATADFVRQDQAGSKLLQLIREALPAVRRAAVLANAGDPFHKLFLEEIQAAGGKLKLEIAPIMLRDADEIDAAFDELIRSPPRTMPAISVEDFRSSELDPLVRMWRESFEFGVGITDPNPLQDQLAYFEREVRPNHRVRLARETGCIVGFLASNAESGAQLHVRVGYLRRGIGRHLLGLAKADSCGTLWLFTFARNATACAFYESQGFRVVRRGFEPPWQLEDVKYAWARPEFEAEWMRC